jgi:hypothetical protein
MSKTGENVEAYKEISKNVGFIIKKSPAKTGLFSLHEVTLPWRLGWSPEI